MTNERVQHDTSGPSLATVLCRNHISEGTRREWFRVRELLSPESGVLSPESRKSNAKN